MCIREMTENNEKLFLCDKAASQALCANLDCAGSAVAKVSLYAYKVGLPNVACVVVSLAYSVSVHRRFSANRACS